MIRLQYKQQLDHLQLFNLEYNQARGMIQYGCKIKSCIKNEYKMNIDFFIIKEGLKSIKPHHQVVGSKQRKGDNFPCNIQSKCKGHYYRIT